METSTTVRSAVYRRHNGTNWEKIYFETSANLVHETDDAWFLKRSNTVNGMSFTKTSGITLTGDNILWKNGVGQYISGKIRDMDNTASDLATRLAKIEKAYGASGDIITTANMNTKITKVGTVTSGTWNGTAIADAYIASASKWNGYGTSKQDKLTFDTVLSDSTTNVPRSSAVKKYVDSEITTVTEIALGRTTTYVIDVTKTSNENKPVLNSEFNVEKTESRYVLTIDLKKKPNYLICDTSGNETDITLMNIGDIILTTGSGIKDWFLGGFDTSEGTVTFYQIDSDTPDLTGYALTSDLGTAASKNVSSRGPSGAGEFLVTEAQVKSFVEGKGYITSYTNTTYTFAEGTTNGAFTVTPSGGSAQSVKVHGLAAAAYKGVDTAAFATNSSSANLPTTAAVAGTIANRATKIAFTTKPKDGTAPEPTGLQTGDIWIELTN